MMILAAGSSKAQSKVRRGKMVQGRNTKTAAIRVHSFSFIKLSPFRLPETKAGYNEADDSDDDSSGDPWEKVPFRRGTAAKFAVFLGYDIKRIAGRVQVPYLHVDHQYSRHHGGKPCGNRKYRSLQADAEHPVNSQHRQGR